MQPRHTQRSVPTKLRLVHEELDAPLHVYVAGPYSNDDPPREWENVQRAAEVGYRLFKMGHRVHVPHLATQQFHRLLPYEAFMETDLSVIERWADTLYYLGSSPGADRELRCAMRCGHRIYYRLDQVPVLRRDSGRVSEK